MIHHQPPVELGASELVSYRRKTKYGDDPAWMPVRMSNSATTQASPIAAASEAMKAIAVDAERGFDEQVDDFNTWASWGAAISMVAHVRRGFATGGTDVRVDTPATRVKPYGAPRAAFLEVDEEMSGGGVLKQQALYTRIKELRSHKSWRDATAERLSVALAQDLGILVHNKGRCPARLEICSSLCLGCYTITFRPAQQQPQGLSGKSGFSSSSTAAASSTAAVVRSKCSSIRLAKMAPAQSELQKYIKEVPGKAQPGPAQRQPQGPENSPWL
ncbi:hypothetical protein BDV95DRAFT_593988 [Massariosphaeria phaeospora]|uniref:Uncharacterized protein n=1 Tax=Massariosphaeria phaeospora TaxID=100035 RepID=A0A7C8I7J5_9PLEO|nr:hypothetical protein BDV95DRAFT_593988 [Massariosphaeria phaeospora]